jgi:PAS domain S-box-containing protein
MGYLLSSDLEQQLAPLAQQQGCSIEDLIRKWMAANDQDLLRQLRQSEALYRAMIESQIDLICRYTPDTILTYVNDAYCHFFDKTREELLGTSYLIFTAPDQHEAIRTRLEAVLRDPSPEVAAYRSYISGGAERWIQWVDHGIVNEQGEVVEIQAVGRDITLLIQLESQHVQAAALQAELAKERELMAIKDQFTSILSHEFRTPLTVIRASTEMLVHYRDRMPPERVEEHLEHINEQVTQMTQLMEDMLTLDRIRAGMLELRPEPLDIVALCQSIVDHFMLADGHQHDIALKTELDDSQFVGDARYLNRVLSNLLSNAVKYSPAGTQVRLDLQNLDDNLLISVRDEGMGIPEDDQSRIFESFFRAKNAQPINGTGLGLAIARQHVEAHGGSIWFQSTPGKGTAFFVRLPRLAG